MNVIELGCLGGMLVGGAWGFSIGYSYGLAPGLLGAIGGAVVGTVSVIVVLGSWFGLMRLWALSRLDKRLPSALAELIVVLLTFVVIGGMLGLLIWLLRAASHALRRSA